MRKFIRHPTDIPIKYSTQNSSDIGIDNLRNISIGGLCFNSSVELEENTQMAISIPLIKPAFRAKGIVVWCRNAVDGEGYDVGVKFFDEDSEHKAWLVEKICQIEHYRKEVFHKEGRIIGPEEAAQEWISKYAEDLPRSQ